MPLCAKRGKIIFSLLLQNKSSMLISEFYKAFHEACPNYTHSKQSFDKLHSSSSSENEHVDQQPNY